VLNPGGDRCDVLVSFVGLCGTCGSLAGIGSGNVVAMVCMVLCIQWLDCWNSEAMALMML
jgi:hypothetical protein